ncbi:MAG: Transcription factor WhiB [Acidimicrobiales bacterium]|nr:Transcription factor WhiB [Acidimicrobiales bacterium]
MPDSQDPMVLPPEWRPPAWMAHAACRGRTELFFAPHAERPQARVQRESRARRICQACPVLFECRNHARGHLEYGVWGGESEDDRAQCGSPVPTPVGGRSRRRLAQQATRRESA